MPAVATRQGTVQRMGGSDGHGSAPATGLAEGEDQQPDVDHLANEYAADCTPLRDKLTTDRLIPATGSRRRRSKGGRWRMLYASSAIPSRTQSIPSRAQSVFSKAKFNHNCGACMTFVSFTLDPKMCAHAQTHKLRGGWSIDRFPGSHHRQSV